MDHTYNWVGNNIEIKLKGRLVIDDIINFNNMIYGDSRFDEMRYQIVDFTDVTEIDITENDIKLVSTLEKVATRWNNNIKIACVAPPQYDPELLDGYIQILSSTGWQCLVFVSFQEAEIWVKE